MTPPQAQEVRVLLGARSYSIWIGSGLLEHLAQWLEPLQLGPLAVVISDENVAPRYGSQVLEALCGSGRKAVMLTVPPGEPSKSPLWLQRLWEQMLRHGADRTCFVVALGGGVVGDLAGMAAATWARGVPWVQLPTTLLAQVDSSVGGKVGVNLPGAKNMVGAFWQPKLVVADIQVLRSLPQREYRAGLAEVVKYGVILDESFFAQLEQNASGLLQLDPQVLIPTVARCCELKAWVVGQDERESSGLRAVLNYGHTFAHALESATGYQRWLHGEAVSLGMNCAALLARELGQVDQEFCLRQARLLKQLGLPVQLPQDLDLEQLVQLMRHDKKAQAGRIRFVLPKRLGQVELVADVSQEQVLRALQRAQQFP